MEPVHVKKVPMFSRKGRLVKFWVIKKYIKSLLQQHRVTFYYHLFNMLLADNEYLFINHITVSSTVNFRIHSFDISVLKAPGEGSSKWSIKQWQLQKHAHLGLWSSALVWHSRKTMDVNVTLSYLYLNPVTYIHFMLVHSAVLRVCFLLCT